jgi:hypothetical protein
MLTVSDDQYCVEVTIRCEFVNPEERSTLTPALARPSVPCPNWAFTPNVAEPPTLSVGLIVKLAEAVPFELVTTTVTVFGPATVLVIGGTMTFNRVLVPLVIVAAMPSNFTVAPEKPVPVIVTGSPDQPDDGAMPVIVVVTGGGGDFSRVKSQSWSSEHSARATAGERVETPIASTATAKAASIRAARRVTTDLMTRLLSVR